VHDETNQAKIGDIVRFYQGRPLAKTKYMYLATVVASSKS
jgi:ribosomal protein S17